MFTKGIIFLLIWLLFLSRLIPKVMTFKDTNQVHLFGHVWEGLLGIFVLVSIAIISIILLAICIRYFHQYFTSKSISN